MFTKLMGRSFVPGLKKKLNQRNCPMLKCFDSSGYQTAKTVHTRSAVLIALSNYRKRFWKMFVTVVEHFQQNKVKK
jgi:hypothetical protein